MTDPTSNETHYSTPPAELKARIERFQDILAREEIDAALIVQNSDLFYFAGTIQQSHLFIPREGDAVLMARKYAPRAMIESPLSCIIRVYSLKEVTEIVGTHDGSPHRLGLELDVLPANLYLRYQNLFPEAELIDISPHILSLRAVKSPFEIDRIRRAGILLDDTFSRILPMLTPGMNQHDLSVSIEAEMRRMGHQGVIRLRRFNQEILYGHALSGPSAATRSYFDGPVHGPGLNPAVAKGSGLQPINVNEPILVDFVGAVDGYLADATRIFCIGSLNERFTRAHQACLEIQEEMTSIAKPGEVCEDLYRNALQLAAERGLDKNFMGIEDDQAPFVAHGVGLELDEAPVIGNKVETVLERYMVIALEPKAVFPDGAVGIENTFVVGENGLRRITQTTDEIFFL
jgi:Xaa-Pro dipeptidase